MSYKEMANLKSPSPNSILCTEFVVARKIYQYWKENKREGISYGQLKDELQDLLSPDDISAALDVLLDYGIISPRNACISLKLDREEKKWWARVYIPGELWHRIMVGLDDLWNQYDEGGERQLRNGSDKKMFSITSLNQIVNFHRDIVFINFIFRFVQDLTKQESGIRRMYAYKLLANILHELQRMYDIQWYIKVKGRQYGAIPILPGDMLLEDLTIARADKLGGWHQEGNLLCSGFNNYGEAIQEVNKYEDISSMSLVTIDIVDFYTTIARKVGNRYFRWIQQQDIRQAVVLNILITCRNCKATLSNAKFEYEAAKEWHKLFLHVYGKYLLYINNKEHLSMLLEHLWNAVEQIYNGYPPYYDKSFDEEDNNNTTNETTTYDIYNIYNQLKPRKNKKIGIEQTAEVGEQIAKKFLQIAYAQSCKAAEQFYKKLNDYLEIVPKIEEFIKDEKDSSKNYKFTYTATLIWPILEPPNKIDEKLYTSIQKLRDGAGSFEGFFSLSKCSLLEGFGNRSEIVKSLGKLRKFYSQAEVFAKDLWKLLSGKHDSLWLYELFNQHSNRLKEELDLIFNQLLNAVAI